MSLFDCGINRSRYAAYRDIEIPGALLEGGCINHPLDGRLIATSQYRDAYARAILEGVVRYNQAIQGKKTTANLTRNFLNFESAIVKADAGDAYAQAVVSIYYGLGLGCIKDSIKSKEYAMKSAKQLNPLGIYRLAEMRESGEAMEKNADQAKQLMQKAKIGLQKLSGDPYAMTALAVIYQRENPASPKARELLIQASDMGYAPAQTKLTQLETNY
jgi:TPR repeat protein